MSSNSSSRDHAPATCAGLTDAELAELLRAAMPILRDLARLRHWAGSAERVRVVRPDGAWSTLYASRIRRAADLVERIEPGADLRFSRSNGAPAPAVAREHSSYPQVERESSRDDQ